MKLLISITILLALSQCSVHYKASTRLVESDIRGDFEEPNEAFGNALRDLVLNSPQPEGYCDLENFDMPVKNKEACGNERRNIGWVFEFWFDEKEASEWKIDFGTDFGRGAAVWANGEFQFSRIDDMWWGGSNWDSKDVFNLEYSFPAGNNYVQVIGSENCCDGGMTIQFTRNGDGPKPFTPENLTCSVSSPKSYITAESRHLTVRVDQNSDTYGEDLAWAFDCSDFNAEGFCHMEYPQWPVNNQKDCGGPDKEISWRFGFQFQLASSVKIEFQLGLDFGKGAAVFIDNALQTYTNQDIWWKGNWENSDVMTVSKYFKAGVHELEVYGIEDCCDGNQAIRFRLEGQEEWLDLTNENWEQVNAEPPKVFLAVETRYFPKGEAIEKGSQFAQNLVEVFNNADTSVEGYCRVENPQFPIQNSSMCGANESIVWRYEYVFNSLVYTKYSFRFGTDFGKGTALYLNGQLVHADSTDLWWSNKWNSSDVFYYEFSANGLSQLVLYGSENCCDGNFDIQFSINGGEYQSINELAGILEGESSICESQAEQLQLVKQKSHHHKHSHALRKNKL